MTTTPWKTKMSLSEITIASGRPLPLSAGWIYDFGKPIGIRTFENDTEALKWYLAEVKSNPELLKNDK